MPNNRTDLSAHTWIEDMPVTYGTVAVECEHGYDHCPTCDAPKKYLVSRSKSVVIDWALTEMELGDLGTNGMVWFSAVLDDDWVNADLYRIPLTDVAPVYAYVEGEPACYVDPYADDGEGQIVCIDGVLTTWFKEAQEHCLSARRAAMVCDTVEQFRVLHGELKGARDQ